MEEERRLAYVGLTRARHRLYLTHASRRATWGRESWSVPSRFLLEIPQELMHGPRLVTHDDYDEDQRPDEERYTGTGYDIDRMLRPSGAFTARGPPFSRGRQRWLGDRPGSCSGARALPPGGGYTPPVGAPREGETFRPSRDLAARREAYYGEREGGLKSPWDKWQPIGLPDDPSREPAEVRPSSASRAATAGRARRAPLPRWRPRAPRRLRRGHGRDLEADARRRGGHRCVPGTGREEAPREPGQPGAARLVPSPSSARLLASAPPAAAGSAAQPSSVGRLGSPSSWLRRMKMITATMTPMTISASSSHRKLNPPPLSGGGVGAAVAVGAGVGVALGTGRSARERCDRRHGHRDVADRVALRDHGRAVDRRPRRLAVVDERFQRRTRRPHPGS